MRAYGCTSNAPTSHRGSDKTPPTDGTTAARAILVLAKPVAVRVNVTRTIERVRAT